jgi:uncharacterized membrane protein YoaK (UPF0700 family)
MEQIRPHDAIHASHLSTSLALAAVGGFLDAFTYVGHGHVFANAQTGNVVLLGIGIATGARGSLRHLPPILAFLVGITVARAMLVPAVARRVPYLYTAVLALEATTFIGIAMLPNSLPDFWITLVISFIASVQVETFNEVNGAKYNSTFTTGNLRTLSESVCDWFKGMRTPDLNRRIRDFGGICIAFLAGAVAGGVSTQQWGNRALWATLLVLVPLILRFSHRGSAPEERPIG